MVEAKQIEAQNEEADPEGNHGNEQEDGHLSTCGVFAGSNWGWDERQKVENLKFRIKSLGLQLKTIGGIFKMLKIQTQTRTYNQNQFAIARAAFEIV